MSDPMQVREELAAVALRVPSEYAMFELLTGLNTSGIHPEVPCMWAQDIGSPGRPNLCVAPFLATLTDPDADRVNYIVSDESGLSRCMVGCDNCGSEGNEEWEPPSYPVTALVTAWPDEARCREDEINVWWIAPTPLVDMVPAEAVEASCRVMHDAYEAAAIDAGWATQAGSRVPWDDVPEANKATMRVAVRALITWLAEPVGGDVITEAEPIWMSTAAALAIDSIPIESVDVPGLLADMLRERQGLIRSRAEAKADDLADDGWVVDPVCRERNPGLDEWHGSCCRFPKSCSPYIEAEKLARRTETPR